MRRLLFSWSVGLLGGVLSAGCAHDKCPRCGYVDSGPLHAWTSKSDRSVTATRTAKQSDFPKAPEPQKALAIGESNSPAESKTAGQAAAQPAAELPFAKQPPAELPAVEQPIVKQPASERPTPEPPTVSQPVSELPPAAEPEKKAPSLPPVSLPFNSSKAAPPASRGMFLPANESSPLPSTQSSGSDGVLNLTNSTNQRSSDEGYKSLTGHVASFRKTWRLRYSSIESIDAQGGSVALQGPGLERLRDGQLVRVSGTIVSAADRNQPAVFEVKAFEVLTPGN